VYSCYAKEIKKDLGCMSGTISEKAVIDTILSVIRLQAQLADNFQSAKSANIKSVSAKISELRGESVNLQRLIEKSKSAKLALWEKQHSGGISRESYLIESEKLSNQVTAYTEKIADLDEQIRTLEMESGQENVFIERFSRQININELTREIVNEFIQSIHVYAPDRIEITLNYADEFERLSMQGLL
jgi:DNA repair exonuclease SbcCD ATPase subunit